MSNIVIGHSRESLFLPAPPSCILRTSLGYVVGTYTLHKNESVENTEIVGESRGQVRSGSLCVVRPESADGQSSFKVINEYETESAVLDLAERSTDGILDFIAVANSTGGIEVWRKGEPDGHEQTSELEKVKTVQVCSKDHLVLRISAHPNENRRSIFAATLSDGVVAVIDVEAETPELWRKAIHSLEPWEVCWLATETTDGTVDSCSILSGGDDAVVELTSLPSSVLSAEADTKFYTAVTGDTKTHQAGVTALLPLRSSLHTGSTCSGKVGDIVLTGSYDDHVRLLRFKPGRRWEVLAEANLGGGVWRLLPLPENRKLASSALASEDQQVCDRMMLLASCMYAGARVIEVLRLIDDRWEIRILAEFTEHESMNYASTIMPSKVEQTSSRDCGGYELSTFITTSFYDKRFCVWTV